MGEMKDNGDASVHAKRESLIAIIKAITDTSSKLVTAELEQLLEKPEIINAPKNIMTYMYAAGFLSFSGRELNKENLCNVVKSLGIEPDEDLIEILLSPKLDIKGHLIYVYGFYFLLVNGVIPTEDNIIKVVSSVNEKGNKQIASEVREFIAVSNV